MSSIEEHKKQKEVVNLPVQLHVIVEHYAYGTLLCSCVADAIVGYFVEHHAYLSLVV